MKHHPERALALEVHPMSFGFTVLESPDHIIDWGVRSFRNGVNAVKAPMRKKIALLIEEYKPAIVLASRPNSGAIHRLGVIVRVAAMYGVPVHTLPRDFAKKAFPQACNKDDRALAVARRITALLPFVPPRRKSWKREHYRMSIFGAAAIGIAHFDQALREERSQN
jgi:hypothetical protein